MPVAHMLAPSWRTADFGDGSAAVAWASPLDPSETKAYTIDCSRELATTDNRIETLSVVPSGVASLAGLTVQEITYDRANITLWMTVAPDARNRANWSGPGETHYLTVTITVTDGQRFERDVSIVVRQLGQT
jgi:hypothetical protein